ncbi:hypothetical protein GF386_02880 [Candidatus Pacearchaeota archaeon]|nr:hypothetical protein [Candidatus Pacearchaeota archaeon]MBD3283093.1 hypothetical protein [Candidatus Pacearchaeota archaeon]
MKRVMLMLFLFIGLLVGDVIAPHVESECSESDSGKDYYNKGYVLVNGQKYEDRCSPDYGLNILVEKYCSGNYMEYVKYECPAGCADGACVQDVTSETIQYSCDVDSDCEVILNHCSCSNECRNINDEFDCTRECLDNEIDDSVQSCKCVNNKCVAAYQDGFCKDSDGGKNFYVKGELDVGCDEGADCGIFYDYCKDDKTLFENYCLDGEPGDKLYECPNGCKDGKCIEDSESVCKDSDNGKEYWIKGEVYVSGNSHSDYCKTEKILVEKYCLENNMQVVEYECPDFCKDGGCASDEEMTEQVKCVFKGSEEYIRNPQKCHSADGRFVCESQFYEDSATCVVDIKGYKGEKITWKSSCGGYAFTIIDGEDEYAEFECNSGEVEAEEILNKGFSFAYWQCYDGIEQKSKDKTSCKPAEVWKRYASEFCESHCKDEKCGVNTFSIWNECYLDGETIDVAEVEGEDVEIQEPFEELSKDVLICKDSCPFDGKCYPFGFRKTIEGNKKYCSDEGEFVKQLEAGDSCDNSFECKSNVCVSSECVSGGLLRKILNWLKSFFGG